MEIQRTKDSITFTLPANMDALELQQIIDYLSYKEATANSKSKQEEIDKIAEESKATWWEENKSKFIK
ncbi:MAG: hypothetical protein RIE86_25170 [Imperialibacter sp.]|uniref:hypothetical protein n=1 Tax=Imperialibacter sp. TaxID=2038411 RepID=UPI0032EB68C6